MLQSQMVSNGKRPVNLRENLANQYARLERRHRSSRAGENGKGFAVVADKVKKLANQISDSVSDITTIVNNSQTESEAVMYSLQKDCQEVEKGNDRCHHRRNIQHRNRSNNLSNIATNSQTMNTSIQEIASVTEESSTGTEKTAASAQQTNSSKKEIATNVTELTRITNNMNKVVHRFKLE